MLVTLMILHAVYAFSGRPAAKHRQSNITDVWFDISKHIWWWRETKTGLPSCSKIQHHLYILYFTH